MSLRNLIVGELAKGFGFFHGKPATAFAPVAVTPDELGDAWDGAQARPAADLDLNGKEFGHPNAATDLTFDFGQLIAHAAKTRHLEAGTVVGSGTVANRDAGGRLLLHRRAARARDDRKWSARDFTRHADPPALMPQKTATSSTNDRVW